MSISKELLSGFPVKIHRPPDDPFFEDGNHIFCFHEKTVNNDIDFLVDSITAVHIDEFKCSVKGCLETFTNPMQYNRHYDMLHKFRCETCARSFSNNHLLSTHISENHDMFFRAQKEKGIAVYHCLIETCGRTFKAMETRRRHLVEKHKYPADFRFNAVKRNHQKYQNSKQQESQSQTKCSNAEMSVVGSDGENPILDDANQAVVTDIVVDKTGKMKKSKQSRNRIKASKAILGQSEGASAVMSVEGKSLPMMKTVELVAPFIDEASASNDIDMDKTTRTATTKQKTKRNRNKIKNKPPATNNNSSNNRKNDKLNKKEEFKSNEDSPVDIEMDTENNVNAFNTEEIIAKSVHQQQQQQQHQQPKNKKAITTSRKIPATICFGRGTPRGFGKI